MSRGGSLILKIVLSVIFILCTAALAAGFILVRMWSGAVTDAKGEVANIASILAQQTFQSVKAVDLVLDELVARTYWLSSETEDDFRKKLRSRDEYEYLLARFGRLPQAEVLGIVDSWPPEISVAVNVSAIQVAQGDLPGLVRQHLAKAGLAGERLEIEITESALLADDDRVRKTLDELRTMGVRIVLDDFGTGFASLSNLNRFSVDKIKIDRSFISRLGGHAGSTAIVEAATMIADAFGVMVTAEGVETLAQRSLLRQMGVVQLQGYLFGAPAPADAWQFEARTGIAHRREDAKEKMG